MPEQHDTAFTYRGPHSGVTLRTPGEPDRELLLVDGATVVLPAEHPYVKGLVALKHLTEVTPPAPAVEQLTPSSSSRPPRSKASGATNTSETTN